MPIIKKENGYFYKKTTKNIKMPQALKMLIFFLIFVFVCGATLYLFSVYNFTSLFGLNKFQIFNDIDYYMVSLKSDDNYLSLTNIATEYKSKGCSGYIMKLDEKYHVVASIYGKQKDAETVTENLFNEGIDASVVVIKLKKLVLTSEYTSEEIGVLKYSLNIVNRTFENLYNLSTRFDRGELLEAEVKQKLQQFVEICLSDKNKLDKVFNSNCDNLVTYAKIFVSGIISSISSLNSSINLTCDIKYSIATTIGDFVALEKNVIKK